jgi:hypothetical protein
MRQIDRATRIRTKRGGSHRRIDRTIRFRPMAWGVQSEPSAMKVARARIGECCGHPSTMIEPASLPELVDTTARRDEFVGSVSIPIGFAISSARAGSGKMIDG